MTRENHTSDPFIPVVLSLLDHAMQRAVWRHLDRLGPGDIYAMLSGGKDFLVQEYLTSRYAEDPREAAKSVIDISGKMNVRIIHYWDDDYPGSLRQISCPPIVLYVAGTIAAADRIAVVGTRNPDARSRGIGRRLSAELSRCGFVVVSGMALGIDREAHLGGLEGGGGTMGVLANGIDVVYPRGNADLFRTIGRSASSALVSEYPPGICAGRWTFVRRNRIISGLSRGTVVVMAGEKSGALITARYAAEQNREVFACPGHTFSGDYGGCHYLIRSGAVLVSKTEDILDELGRLPLPGSGSGAGGSTGCPGFFKEKTPRYDENSIEGRLLSLISGDQVQVDSVIRGIGEPAGTVQRALSRLELDGAIGRNGNYIWRT